MARFGSYEGHVRKSGTKSFCFEDEQDAAAIIATRTIQPFVFLLSNVPLIYPFTHALHPSLDGISERSRLG